MQEHYNSEDHMEMVQVISKLYCHKSEEELGQTSDQFWIEDETFWSRTGSFQTSCIWKSSAIKYGNHIYGTIYMQSHSPRSWDWLVVE